MNGRRLEKIEEGVPARAYAKLSWRARRVYREMTEGILRVVERYSPEVQRLRLLDVGTGPGILLSEILRGYEGEVELVVGIDCTRETFGECFKSYVRDGEFIQGNAYYLPFRDACFDVCISTGVLHALKWLERFFSEMVRVTRSGGLVIVYDPTPLSVTHEEARRVLSEEEYKLFEEVRKDGIVPETFEPEEIREVLGRCELGVSVRELKKERLGRLESRVLQVVMQKD